MMYISQNPKNRESMAVLTNIIRKTSNGEIANLQTMISCIFPEYGTSALDIPYYDSEKHMYLVDQYTAESGNRQITYVAAGRKLCVEVTLGFYHSWTFMNKVRVMIPNRESLKVVKIYEWPQSSYYDVIKLSEKIRELVREYAADNLQGISKEETEQLKEFVDALIYELLSGDVESHDRNGSLEVLAAYCKQMKVCRDFVTF
jgi:hypothetical protein